MVDLSRFAKPVRTDAVVFADRSTSDYRPPINTLDQRYAACTDHHVGCDCREADLREDIVDIRADYERLRAEHEQLRQLVADISAQLAAVLR